MGAQRNSLLRRRAPVRNAHASRSPGGHSVGVRSPVLPDFERRGGRRLARQSGRLNKVPATNAGRLRPGLFAEISVLSTPQNGGPPGSGFYFSSSSCTVNSFPTSPSFPPTTLLS